MMMKRICVFAILSLLTLQSFSQKQKKFPETYSFTELSMLQQKERRPVLVFLHTDWCKYCFAMKKKTFTDERVINLLNKSFYFIMLNGETKENITFNGHTFTYKPSGTTTGTHELAEALATIDGRVEYPGLVILNAGNEIAFQDNSFLTKEQLFNILFAYINAQKK